MRVVGAWNLLFTSFPSRNPQCGMRDLGIGIRNIIIYNLYIIILQCFLWRNSMEFYHMHSISRKKLVRKSLWLIIVVGFVKPPRRSTNTFQMTYWQCTNWKMGIFFFVIMEKNLSFLWENHFLFQCLVYIYIRSHIKLHYRTS